MKINKELVYSIGVAVAVLALCVFFDKSMVKIFGKAYWKLPREQMFAFGWPPLTLLASFLFLKMKYKIIGRGFMLVAFFPLVMIAGWSLVWGLYWLTVAMALLMVAIRFVWNKYFIPMADL